MSILALEPYYGGSHKAFLDGWSTRSSAQWTVLGLPAYTWKWRMRHAAITFSDQVRELVADGERFEAIFCSDMLNLAEFRGLAPPEVARLPCVAYFHENQLTYPDRHAGERDLHYAFTNLTTALSADAVWFNSKFHCLTFTSALDRLLARMPDHQPYCTTTAVRKKSAVMPPGIDGFPERGKRRPGPPRLLWAARWEHDKNPEALFQALDALMACRVDFRISVIGEQFKNVPDIFEHARPRLADHLDHWGYLPDRDSYRACLMDTDIFISTANHEFFGISVVEAISAGAFPLLPSRLAYPGLMANMNEGTYLSYDGSTTDLIHRLRQLIERCAGGTLWPEGTTSGRDAVAHFEWTQLVPRLDEALLSVAFC